MNYEIFFDDGKIPDWFSYHEIFFGEDEMQDGLSYHEIFFHGLALWIVFEFAASFLDFFVIIKNKSNGIQLFKYEVDTHDDWLNTSSWMVYVRREDLAMKEYWAEELELEVRPKIRSLYESSGVAIGQIGIHVIVEEPGSFEELESEWEWEWDHDINNLQETTSAANDEEGDEIDSQTETESDSYEESESQSERDLDVDNLQETTSSANDEEGDEIVSQIETKSDSYEESESQSERDHDVDNLQGTTSSMSKRGMRLTIDYIIIVFVIPVWIQLHARLRSSGKVIY